MEVVGFRCNPGDGTEVRGGGDTYEQGEVGEERGGKEMDKYSLTYTD
jgi:hypothetical protein